jgi:hypothetical protein
VWLTHAFEANKNGRFATAGMAVVAADHAGCRVCGHVPAIAVSGVAAAMREYRQPKPSRCRRGWARNAGRLRERHPQVAVEGTKGAGIVLNSGLAKTVAAVGLLECLMLARRHGSFMVRLGHGYVMVNQGMPMDRPDHMPT